MLEVIVSVIDKKNRECTYHKHNSHRVSIYNEKKSMLPLDCVDKNFSMKPIDYLEKNSSNRYFSGQYPLEKKGPTHTNCNVITTICTDILTRKIDLQSFFQ